MMRPVQVIGGARLAIVLCVGMALTGLPGEAAADVEQERPALFTFIEADELEYRASRGEDAFTWEAQAWVGGDYHKAWFKTRGTDVIDGPLERAELQLLYSRAASAFWDLQAGGRYDIEPEPSRGYAVLGVQGLAPYFFEMDAAVFVSTKGDVSGRIEAEYEVLLTQRLIAKPSAELDFAVQEVEEFTLGSGVTTIELGLRLRYEIVREFAPYVGVDWERKIGPTADRARRLSADVDDVALVTGVRLWF